MRAVGVFCGSSPGARPGYGLAAARLGEVLARGGIRLVYGGAGVGTMGTLATSALAAGGSVVGIIPRFLMSVELPPADRAEIRIVETLHERKAAMEQLSDGFVALPGGFGTLDELAEILTWAQLGLHTKPVGLLNVDGYFDRLVDFLDHAVAERFARPEHRDIVLVDEDPQRLLDAMRNHRPTVDPRWFERG